MRRVRHFQQQHQQHQYLHQQLKKESNSTAVEPIEITSMKYIPVLSPRTPLRKKHRTYAPKSTKLLGNIFSKTKTKIPKSDQTGVIYRIPCT